MKSFVIPLAIILAILHSIVIAMILLINQNSSALSGIMKSYGSYVSEASSLLAGSSLLSETSSIYVLNPTTETGDVNFGPLMSYSAELTNNPNRRGDVVAKRFKEYDVSDEAVARIEAAAESAAKMMEAQIHAIALVKTVYHLPDIPALKAIPEYTLSDEENAYSADAKLAYATKLLYGDDYSEQKRSVSENVTSCIAILQAEQGQKSAVASQNITMTRLVLWIVTISVIVLLIFALTIFIRLFVAPIGGFVKKISLDEELNEKQGLYEVRLLASSYNTLITRKAHLENALRLAAETDSLTGLPNRYSFNHFITKKGERGYSIAIFLFDINFLKETNDTKGHLEGDNLIKKASECILECFGSKEEPNCFRFGGDEFAAFLKNTTVDEIDKLVEKFRSLQEKLQISVAIGYSYTEDIGKTTLDALFKEADSKMYDNKTEIHKKLSQN